MKDILTFLILFTCTFLSTAQDASWVNYTHAHRTGGMLETTNTIWLGTSGGLLEINKNTWTSSYWTKANAGLSSNMIEDIAIHPNSQDIYIGTYDVALMVKENGSDSWETLPYPSNISHDSGLPVLTYCLEFDEEGVLWIGTDKGLVRYDGESWDLIDSAEENLLGAVWDIQFDEDGKKYISSHGLYKLEGEELSLLSPDGPNEGDFLFGYAFTKLFRGDDGEMWFFTDLGTVGHFDGTQWTIESLPNSGFIGMGFFSVGYNSDDLLEVMVSGKEPYLLTESGWEQVPAWYSGLNRQYFLDDGTRLGTADGLFVRENGELYNFTNYPFRNIPFRLKNDHEGRLWMVDSANVLLNPATWETFVAEGELAPVAGFNDYVFANDGSFWCTSGRAVYHYKDNQWTKYDYTNSILPDVYGYNSIQSIDGEEAWLDIYDEGFYHFQNGNWEAQIHPAFNYNKVFGIQLVPGGVWVEMMTPNYVHVLGFWDGEELDIIEDQENGFSVGSIASFTYDASKERLWVLGYDQVQYYQDGSWYPFELPSYIFEEGHLKKIIVQEDQMVFYGSYRMYLYRAGQWQTVNAENSPLSNQGISEVGLDENGYLWITRSNTQVVDRFELGLLNADQTVFVHKKTNMMVLENPVREGLLKIASPTLGDKNTQLMILDAAGRRYAVNIASIMNNKAIVNVSHLPSGWYLINVITTNGIQSQPFIK